MDDPWVMYLVVRKDVPLGRGQAMAQAGHAALECAQTLGTAHEGSFAAWRSAGRPGEVRLADAGAWDAVRAHAAAGAGVVVSDAGLTQVAPGTETVAAFPPSPAVPALLDALPVLP